MKNVRYEKNEQCHLFHVDLLLIHHLKIKNELLGTFQTNLVFILGSYVDVFFLVYFFCATMVWFSFLGFIEKLIITRPKMVINADKQLVFFKKILKPSYI
jgi:hypothetical protein